MNKYYIYIGIALAIVIIALFVFKAELSAILMPPLDTASGENRRIMSITGDGAIILSDNTITDINKYIYDSVYNSNTAAIAREAALKTELEELIENRRASLATSLKIWVNQKDFLRNKDKVAFARTIGQGNPDCRGKSGVGDCRAVVDMWNPSSSSKVKWNDSPQFRVDSSGGWKYDHAPKGQIHLVRAGY